MSGNRVQFIDLWPPMVRCCICNVGDFQRWGIPVNSLTGEIVANDFDGDWCGKPVCRECFERHESGEFVGDYPKY